MACPTGSCFSSFSIFSSIPDRKNPLGLVDAFERAFSQEDEPLLVIKSINGNRRLNYLERLRARVANMSNVLLLEDYMSAEDKNGLLALCDSYVSLHRSEGTGLTLAEAMALGKPVIGTAYSGNLEFMTEHNSYLVDYVKAEVPAGCDPYPKGWHWADPILDDAAEAMSKVFEDRGEAARRGARARTDILEKHDAATCGARMAAPTGTRSGARLASEVLWPPHSRRYPAPRRWHRSHSFWSMPGRC